MKNDALPAPGKRAAIRSLIDVGTVFSGRLGGVVLNLLFLPLYDALLGPQLFGAVAIILSLLSFFMVFDFGAATLVATDVAASGNNPGARAAAGRDWRRSELMIVGLAALGLVAGVVISRLGMAGIFSAADVVLSAVLIAGLVLLNVGQAAMNGLQAYRLNNGLMLAGVLTRGVVTVLVLQRFEPSLTAFLAAQALVSTVHYGVLRGILSGRLAVDSGRLLERGTVQALWLRMRPLIAYTLAGAVVMQIDKPLVASFFSLEMAGRWFLATTYALTPMAVLAGPLNQYFYPKIVASQGDPHHALVVGRRFQIAVSLAVTAPTVVLVYFATDVLSLWLPHAQDIDAIAPVAQLLVAAAAFGATGYLPTAWLLASGDRAWLARLSAAAAILVIALLVILGPRQEIMLFAAVYAGFHVGVCIMLWARMLRSWPGREAGWALILSSWIGPILFAGGATLGLCVVIGSLPMAGWARVLAASAAGAFASLVVAWLWWVRYSAPPAPLHRR